MYHTPHHKINIKNDTGNRKELHIGNDEWVATIEKGHAEGWWANAGQDTIEDEDRGKIIGWYNTYEEAYTEAVKWINANIPL